MSSRILGAMPQQVSQTKATSSLQAANLAARLIQDAARQSNVSATVTVAKVPPGMLSGSRFTEHMPYISTLSIKDSIQLCESVIQKSHAKKDQDHLPLLMDVQGKSPYKIGIIGGMGPQATLHLMSHFPEGTRMFVAMIPHIPDRTQALLSAEGGQARTIIENLLRETSLYLLGQDANLSMIPCNTAHAFSDHVQGPFLNMIEATALHLMDNNVREIISFATRGTNTTGVYDRVLDRVTGGTVSTKKPTEGDQATMMEIIYTHIKNTGSVTQEAVDLYLGLVKKYIDKHVQEGNQETCHFGWFCTEFPLVGNDQRTVDALKRDVVELKSGEKKSYFEMARFYDPMQINAESALKQL